MTEQTEPQKSGGKSRALPGAIAGGVAGLPLSYFLQNEMVRAKLNIVEYTSAMVTEASVFSQNDMWGPVVAGVVIFAVVGGLIGHFLGKK